MTSWALFDGFHPKILGNKTDPIKKKKSTAREKKLISFMVKSIQTCHFVFYPFSVAKLPNELQMLEEDPSQYKAPQDGNLVYKLFSLNDLLLLVRCSVQKVTSLPRYHKKKKAPKVQVLLLGCFVLFFKQLSSTGISGIPSLP